MTLDPVVSCFCFLSPHREHDNDDDGSYECVFWKALELRLQGNLCQKLRAKPTHMKAWHMIEDLMFGVSGILADAGC